MKVQETQDGLSEQYLIKFWYTNLEGFYRQEQVLVYSNSRSAHSAVEKYFDRIICKRYNNPSLISITYC